MLLQVVYYRLYTRLSQVVRSTIALLMFFGVVMVPRCRSGFTTLPPEPLPERPAVVLLRGRPLAFLVVRSV
jgi:hypothetical protein